VPHERAPQGARAVFVQILDTKKPGAWPGLNFYFARSIFALGS